MRWKGAVLLLADGVGLGVVVCFKATFSEDGIPVSVLRCLCHVTRQKGAKGPLF